MKKTYNLLVWGLAFFLLMSLSTSCGTKKTGCPTSDYRAKTGRDGNLKGGKTKSGLLPKSMKKKKKKKKKL